MSTSQLKSSAIQSSEVVGANKDQIIDGKLSTLGSGDLKRDLLKEIIEKDNKNIDLDKDNGQENDDDENNNNNENNNEDNDDNDYGSSTGGFGDYMDDPCEMLDCEDFNDDDNEDENSLYLNDPEHFDYECYPIEKIDWIMERKCERLIENLKLEDPFDALYLLKQFKWNLFKIVELYEKDKQTFLQTYFSDNNNNKSKTPTTNFIDRSILSSYINIFSITPESSSKLFNPKLLQQLNKNSTTNSKQSQQPQPQQNLKLSTYCNICCMQKPNFEMDMAALNECLHYFCRDCWRMHFESLISSSTSSALECMQTKCKSLASKDFVLSCLNYNLNCAGGSNNIISYNGLNNTPTCLNNSISGGGGGFTSFLKQKSYSERYRHLVAVDLINESEDLQMCPGEIVESSAKPAHLPSYSCNSFTSTPPVSRLNHITSNSAKSQQQYTTPTSIPSTPMMSSSSSMAMYTPTPNPTPTSSVAAASSFTTTASINSTPVVSSLSTPYASQSVSSQKCKYIVWIKSKPAARRVKCSLCSTQYCFLCSLPYHAPNSCQTIRKWHIKCQDDSETRNYLLVHTQDCPKCKVCIEKNGGCSHMTCNRCKHEFCWVCLNDWKTHGATYDCNRYKGNPEQDNAREALNRYTHYYHRWINHTNSLKFEKAFKEQCQLRIQEKIMNRGGGTLVDWDFLTEAADTLTRARYTLQYTYPYAYYLENNESKLLFENIQAELERDVENLSHSLEKVNLNDKYNIKIQMNIVEKRRKTLLKDFIQ